MLDINNWVVLQKLNIHFYNNIKFISICGSNVIIVTKSDKVFSYGNNTDGCLGLGHYNTVDEPQVVSELCNKQLIKVAFGSTHMLFLTKSGECYSSGGNDFGQLGNGTIAHCNKPKLIESLIEKHIVDISCGYFHNILLTNRGQVYSFGRNNCGQIGCNNENVLNQLTPILINGFNSEKVIAISCGGNHSLALTESGHVFSWGKNCENQLGDGTNVNRNDRIKVHINDGVVIKKIICGSNHNLLLTSDGQIYAFGSNDFGQIGNGTKMNQKLPLKLDFSVKMIDIWSGIKNDISIAKSENNNCYVWGDCVNQIITIPKVTKRNSILNVISIYAKVKVTHKPIYIDTNSTSDRILNNMKTLFNNQTNSDFKFKIEGKYIYSHKLILKSFCEHFRVMFSENWSKSDLNEIEITQYSYFVYYSFLKYLYTDSIDIELKEVFDLYDLANSYLEEDLKRKCIQIMKTNISIENFCLIYSIAIKYNSEDLEKYCVGFAANKFFEIGKTDAFQQMDDKLCKKLVTSLSFK
jgi:RCC1 and BTB domain-containing protein